MTNLEKNLEALKEMHPVVYETYMKEDAANWITETEGDIGINLVIKDGAKIYTVDDSKQQTKEAETYVKDLEYNKEDMTSILGFGTGVLINEIVKKMEKGHSILVIEPVADFARVAFTNFDFSEEIRFLSLVPIICPEKDDVSGVFGQVENLKTVQQWHLIVPEYTKIKPKLYHQWHLFLYETINQVSSNTGTVAAAGEKIAQNDIESLPYIMRCRGVAELHDLFKGKPAILVSTGPSLEKNIHVIKELQKKAVIVCVGQAIRPLLAYGIKPDFACSVDYGEVNMSHYKGLMDCGIPLVALNRSYAPLLMEYQGPKFIVVSPSDFPNSVVSLLQDKGSLDQGGSVAHLCLSFAAYLGCEPIIFTGQDLSLGEHSHSKLADTAGKVRVDETGTIQWEVTDQTSHLHGGTYSMGPIQHVAGFFGGQVPTNTGLAAFITAFENMIRHYDVDIYNCTQGGAYIQGTKHRYLKDVLNQEMDDVDKDLVSGLLSEADNADEVTEKAIPVLQAEIGRLDEVILHSKKALQTNKKLRQECKKDRRHKLNHLLQENEKHSEQAQKACTKLPLVNLAIYGAKRHIESRDMKAQMEPGKLKQKRNQDTLLKRIKRNKYILLAAKKCAERMKKLYVQAIKDINKKVWKSKREPEDHLESLKEWEEYFAAGNFAHPMLDALEVLKIEPDNLVAKSILAEAYDMREEAIEKVTEIYDQEIKDDLDSFLIYNEFVDAAKKLGGFDKADSNDYEKAKELLTEAYEMKPEEPQAIWGLANVHQFNKEYDEALEMYNELVDLPNLDEGILHKFICERAILMLNIPEKKQEGLDDMVNLVELSTQFEHFLFNIAKILAEQNNLDDAYTYTRRYLKAYPVNREAVEFIAAIGSQLDGVDVTDYAEQLK